MAEVEDELLALAGGDTDDDDASANERSPSRTPPAKQASKKDQAMKSDPRSKADESEEEGEASDAPSSPNSLESAPMDESDSDEEPPRPAVIADDDVDAKYPVDGTFMSQAEKAEVMALREVEREQIIADRHAEIERMRQNRLLRQMVTNQEAEEKRVRKKRSADTAELDDDDDNNDDDDYGKPAKTRAAKGGSAMESLRKARADKQRRKEDQERRKDTYSPRRGRDDKEDEFGRAQSRTPEPEDKKQPPLELRDFERVRLGRNEFSQVCYTPGFQSAIIGCFIRIALGPHPETHVEQYRMAIIKGFTSSRPYALTGPTGAFITDQYVKAAHGKAIKEFPFIAASSGNFTDAELRRYEVTCNNENVTMPTKASLQSKIDDINSLINHNWTSEEIKTALVKKKEWKKKFDPQERVRVARLLEEARELGEDDKVEELTEELEQLGNQRLAFKTSLGLNKGADAARTEEAERLAERNRENRRMNVEAVRRAQLKEKAKVREIEAATKRGETVQDDLSRRLRTKAKFVHNSNDTRNSSSQNDSQPATPANGTSQVGPTKQPLLHMVRLQEANNADKKGLPTIHKPLLDDDVIGSLDLDIDIDI